MLQLRFIDIDDVNNFRETAAVFKDDVLGLDVILYNDETKEFVKNTDQYTQEMFDACKAAIVPEVKSISKILFSDDSPLDYFDFPICVRDKNSHNYGATAILKDGLIDEIANGFDDDVIIIPSSIHEVLVAPASVLDLNNATQMVKEVNEEQVAVKDRLYNGAFLYKRKGN